MKLVIDLPEHLLKKVRGEIERGQYETPQEFVRVAFENQLEIGSWAEGEGELPTIDEYLSSPAEDNEQDIRQSMPGLFQVPVSREISVYPAPDSDRLTSGPLWGQYNRIFPVKLVVRALAAALANSGSKEVPFEGFRQQVASQAREIGMQIKDSDTKQSRSRGEKLSSGLPVGEDAAKSTDRFLSHFVGRCDGSGNLKGAPAQLGLINILEKSSEKVGITEQGLEFAQLENPLLDESLEASTPLSDDEKEFYLQHTSRARPGEYEAIISMGRLIANGTNRPEDLTGEVAKLNSGWSQAQADTMRTGLLSRMFELGLVGRRRVGQRGVAYELTSKGMEVIENE